MIDLKIAASFQAVATRSASKRPKAATQVAPELARPSRAMPARGGRIASGKERARELTVRVRDSRHIVRITTYDGGAAPGTGIGQGASFDAAWQDVTEVARKAG